MNVCNRFVLVCTLVVVRVAVVLFSMQYHYDYYYYYHHLAETLLTALHKIYECMNVLCVR